VPRWTVEHALYVGILVVGFALRIWDVGSRAMHGDESVHAWMAWRLFTGQGYQYDPVYHGPLQFPVTAVFFFLFGDSETTGRLMSVLFGTAFVGLPFFLRREMGRAAALIAAFLIAISPEFVYDSRLERDDSFTVLFAMVLAIAIFGYLRTRRLRFVYLGAAAAVLSLDAMENTYITYFVFGSFLALVLFGEYLAGRVRGAALFGWTGEPHRIAWAALGGLGIVLAVALGITMVRDMYPPVPIVLAVALILLVSRQAFFEAREHDSGRFTEALRSIPRVAWLNAFTIIVALLFAFYSTFGTNLHGIWDSSQPFFNNGSCTGNSFPLNPCRKDIIGGLFYWLSQHKVARGGQPWFYYSFLFSLYEQLVLLFGLAGIVYFVRRPSIFRTFVVYWAVLTFGIYSWAGEKFPWLLVHPLLPFTLLAAMFLSTVLTAPRPWMYLGLGVAGLLALLEIHSMYEVNFVNGADPVEMMVYVQSAPDTPKVAAAVEALSQKVTGGNSLAVTVDTEETWPFAWYLRNMTDVAYPSSSQMLSKPYSANPVIIADMDNGDQARLAPRLNGKYTGHLYTLRWWFPEDYKDLTWSTFWQDAKDPGYWSVIGQWLVNRRPFGPKGTVDFYYYVKKGLASPY
jgi:uncharacterized protein (TIGR03663 family)